MLWRPDIILQHAFTFERDTVTPYTFAIVFGPAFASYYVMAVLVQLPRTDLFRVSLLPAVFWLALRANASLDFSWNYSGYAYLNQGLALGMFSLVMRSMAWAFATRPYARLLVSKLENGSTHCHNGNTPIEHTVSTSTAMWNAWDLIVNLRGIGWSGLPKTQIPTSYIQVKSRLQFLLLSFCRLVLSVVVFDVLCKSVCSFGPDTFGTPKGGTIFDSSLPPLARYTKSSIITLLSGFSGYAVIEAVYQLHAVLFTLLFQQGSSQWPPLFDSPWFSTSLASFWGRRWHQLFREPFVVVGSKPFERYLGRFGAIMGAFALSGALHDFGMRGMRRGTDTVSVVGFFLMQGVGMIMERGWKQATGRRVGGILGWFWVFSWLTLWGQFVVEVWAQSGLTGSEFFPEANRPTTLILHWISQVL